LKLKNFERITSKKIDVDSVVARARGPRMGGIVAFIGTVRNHSEAGSVDGIFYDSHVGMAEKRMLQVEEEVKSAFPEGNIAVQHRIGKVGLEGVTLVVAASAPHRADAFAACRLGLELIKKDVPIWKKESLVGGGERWVEGETAGTARKKRAKRTKPQ
jgi:molybdopterin synthase catalytic subunit